MKHSSDASYLHQIAEPTVMGQRQRATMIWSMNTLDTQGELIRVQ